MVVTIGSDLYGDAVCVARDVSVTGVIVEMPYMPPVGTVVTVMFGDIMIFRAKVVDHRYTTRDRARLVRMDFIEGVDRSTGSAMPIVH